MDQEKFIKGFNHGYILQEHEPELLAKVLKSPGNQNDYFDGLKHGQKQQEKEQFIQQAKDAQQSRDNKHGR